MHTRHCWFSAAILLPTLCIASVTHAGTFRCGTGDTTIAPPVFTRFYPYRSGQRLIDLTWRDVEFMWDSLYAGGLTVNVKLTLDSLANHLVVRRGRNPFHADFSEINLIYEYFRREDVQYTTSVFDSAAMRIGWQTDPGFGDGDFLVLGYKPSDRSHVDCYAFNPVRGTPSTYPSEVHTDDEDITSDRGVRDVRTANTVRVEGPPAGLTVDLSGTGWTAPDSIFITGFDHEIQHGLPPQQEMGFSSEMFSACAEAIGGNSDTDHVIDEVPYTWSLIGQDNAWANDPTCSDPPAPGCVRRVGSNQAGRTLFGAYLAYNFRGGDTSATLPTLADPNRGLGDDLVWKWARSTGATTGRRIAALRNLLRDNSCGTCSTKTYFHPAGVPLDTISRMALLHHNWRVANYVNNSALDEGQYGYPPQFGFTPSRQLGAWRSIDPYVSNDIIAIPPEVTLNSTHRTRELMVKGERSFGGSTYPLVLQPYGAEYWIVRSDPTIWTAGQDLVVRVHPEGIHREEVRQYCDSTATARRDGRLLASVVAYAVPADSVAGARLWAHPEWAKRAIPPKWVDVDSLAGPLEFLVPSFGDSFKAAVVVLSLADGPSQWYDGTKGSNGSSLPSAFPSGLSQYVEAIHYRLDLGIRGALFLQPNPVMMVGTSAIEDAPTWSSDGSKVAYTSISGSTKTIKYGPVSVPGSSATYVPAGESPDWSPAGDVMVFVRDSVSGQSRVHRCNGPGGFVSKLTVKSGIAASPVFSPNGQKIAYGRSINDLPAGSQILGATCPSCGWELRRVDLNGTNDILLLRLAGHRPMRSIRWSPDGRWIYLKKSKTLTGGFPGPDELWVVASDGSGAFTRSGLLDDVGSFDLHRGNGPLLLEQGGTVQWSSTCYQPSISTTLLDMPFLRIGLRDTLANDTGSRFYRTGAEFYNPRWSPDGTRIAYSSNQNLSSDRDVFVGQVSFNRPPTLIQPQDELAYTARPFERNVMATDPDGEAVTYQAADGLLPPGASFTPATGRFFWPSPGPVCSEHFVTFRALDGSGGVASRVTKFTTVIDSVDDLNVDIVGESEVGLSWTAPGDNGPLGRGFQYELRYSQFPLTEGTFLLGSLVTGMASPAPAGTPEWQLIEGLTPGTTYYFGIRTKDNLLHWSLVSVVSVTTMDPGGGGGNAAQEVIPGPMGLRATDLAIVSPGGVVDSAGVLSVEMGLNSGAPVWSIRQLGPVDVTALGVIDSIGVLLQSRDEIGTWYTRAQVTQADAAWRYAICALRRPGRIVFRGSYGLRQAWGTVRLDGRSTAYLQIAQHSRLGDLTSTFDSTGGAWLVVNPTDTLKLTYDVRLDTSDTAQDWFMLVGPPGSQVSTPTRARRGAGVERLLPTVFALRQNHPNPFSGRTTIRFELPVECPVRLEVFDAQGRLIRRLVDGQLPAGFHAVEWDKRTAGGQSVGAGVYLYRFQAGEFHDRKKMVLLPG